MLALPLLLKRGLQLMQPQAFVVSQLLHVLVIHSLHPFVMSACNRQGYTPLTMKRKLKGLHRAACIKQADYHSQSPPHCRAEGKPARDKERSSKSAYLWGLIKTQLKCCIVSLPVTPGCSTQLFEQENKIKLPVLPRQKGVKNHPGCQGGEKKI